MRKHILYLASGSARRFGSNKLLHIYEGKPLFQWGLETLVRATQGDADCTLTVVSRYEQIRQAARSMGVRAVDSPRSSEGISHTIRAGLDALEDPKPEDFLLFAVADQPWLTESTVKRLLEKASDGVLCASVYWGDRPGNPTLFSARLILELRELEGDTGGRTVLRRHDCIPVSADSERELEDIDIPI